MRAFYSGAPLLMEHYKVGHCMALHSSFMAMQIICRSASRVIIIKRGGLVNARTLK